MAKDRYKYFRIEARELLEGLNRSVLELEKGGPSQDLIARILRLAHTLKGAARVVKEPGIADAAHGVEDVFAGYREGRISVPQKSIEQALALLDTISGKIASLDLPVQEARAGPPQSLADDLVETARVEIKEVDKLLDGVSEAGVQMMALRREADSMARLRQLTAGLFDQLFMRSRVEANGFGMAASNVKARASAEELHDRMDRLERALRSGMDQLETEFVQVRDAANRLRLLPAATIFPPLERAVRDAAQSLNKDVTFESVSGDHRLDAHVLAAVRGALLHILRNAVAHGIETRSERAKAGKPPRGRIELRVERRGNRIAFICHDDGKGIDVDAIREVAVRRRLVTNTEAASLGLEEAVRILLKGGVTTSPTLDELSGRGIGLDVVRETTARLRGEISITSERGQGTCVEINVPVSLSSMAALQLKIDGTVGSVPLDAIREVVLVQDHDIARSEDRESIVYAGKIIPFLNLAGLLGKTATHRRQTWSAVVLETNSGMAAIAVERLVGANTVIVRPLPTLAKADPLVVGASLDTEGNPQLVFDPEGLVAKASTGALATLTDVPQRRNSVLVIDDSLTTRMLQQSILESAGFDVDLATSGEEGLHKANERAYHLFLVDVEMPGMDGFEFVTRTQTNGKLRSVPSILVTSRSSVEDRRRGKQVGARGYVAKGEFDQEQLLRMIGQLLGQEDAEDTRFGR